MSKIYDNWGKLVAAVDKREQYRKLCYVESLHSSFNSVHSSDYDSRSSSRRYSFDLSSADQLTGQPAPEDGNSQRFATTSSAKSRFNHVPKPPNMQSGSRFDKNFGAARRFVTPMRNRPESQINNLSQDINAPEIQSGYSAPVELEVKREIPTVDVYALSFKELEEQTSNFGRKAQIAEDFYGKVYFARLKSGKGVTLRMLDALTESDSDDGFLAKVSTMSGFMHENLVEFLGYSIERYRRILAYEFPTMGTLHDILHGSKGVTGVRNGPVLDWMQRVRIAVDTAKGLEYLHENAVVHKAITSSNVFLFNDFKTKIGGINLSTKWFYDYVERHPCYYLIHHQPPEYVMFNEWTQKSDIYSFGVVLLELLTGRMALDYTLPQGQDRLLAWAVPKLSEGKVKHCVDPKLMGEYPPKGAAKLASIAALCVQYGAGHRPDMKSILKALQPLLEAPAPGT